MNRAAKRPDQGMTEADTIAFLKEHRLGVLSTTGYGKAPYGVPMYYTWTEEGPSFRFTEGQLWDHLRYDSRVCLTVTDEKKPGASASALVFGDAEITQTPDSSQPGSMRIQVISVSGLKGGDLILF